MGDFATRSENALACTPIHPEISNRMARLCRPESFQLPLLNTERLQMCLHNFPADHYSIGVRSFAYMQLRTDTCDASARLIFQTSPCLRWTWPHFKATLSEKMFTRCIIHSARRYETAMRTNRKIGFLKHSVQTRKAKRSSRATLAPSTSCFSMSWQGKTITHLSVRLSEWIEEAENVALSSLSLRYWPQLSTQVLRD